MAAGQQVIRFEDLTETTGIAVSPEGADMMYTRYALAAELSRGRRILELGCGAGQGFGLVGAAAASLMGGDYSLPLLESARSHYGARYPLVDLSAEDLPFRARSFDVVLFFEATYYVPDMAASFREIERVLAPGGEVLFVNANPERPDFIRSPHSVHYHTAEEFRRELETLGFKVHVEGAFPVNEGGSGRAPGATLRLALPLARKLLEGLRLVPRTLRGRARLKRLVYRSSLRVVPPELPPAFAQSQRRQPLASAADATRYKVLYVHGHKPGTTR